MIAAAIGVVLVVGCSAQTQVAQGQALPQTFTQGALNVRYPADWHLRTVGTTSSQVTPSTATGSPLVFSDSEPADWEDGTGPTQIWLMVSGSGDGPPDLTAAAKTLSSSDEATDVEQGTTTVAGRDATSLTWTTTKASGMPLGFRFGMMAFQVGPDRSAVAWANSPDADPDGSRISSILDAIDVTTTN